jgi:hypothetical protein
MSQERIMRSLFREVMVPAAASVGFLVAMAMPPAEAQEVAAEPASEVLLASARPVASISVDESGTDAGVAREPTRGKATARSTPRPVRVKRIGKFTIQRWE